jgi:hypothetical protein
LALRLRRAAVGRRVGSPPYATRARSSALDAPLEAEASAKQLALPTKRYGVIYADPPWRFEPWSRVTGMDRAADNHYPTMTTADICALDVPSIAADDCALFLWATSPMVNVMPPSEAARLQIADQAKELGIEIDLSYRLRGEQ